MESNDCKPKKKNVQGYQEALSLIILLVGRRFCKVNSPFHECRRGASLYIQLVPVSAPISESLTFAIVSEGYLIEHVLKERNQGI